MQITLQEQLNLKAIQQKGNIVLIDPDIFDKIIQLQPPGEMTWHFLLRSYSHRINPSLEEIPSNTYASVELINWAVKKCKAREYHMNTISDKLVIVLTKKKENWKRLKDLGFERRRR